MTNIIYSLLLLISIFVMFDANGANQQYNNMMDNNMDCATTAMPQGIDPQLLPNKNSQSAQTFIKYCSQCHRVPGPGLHTSAQWPSVIERMNKRMKMMSQDMMMMNIKAPTEKELALITEYVTQNAQQAMTIDEIAKINSTNGEKFKQVCAQCHALPNPAKYPKSAWPSIIKRMRANMLNMGKTPPDENTTNAILNFLVTQAKY